MDANVKRSNFLMGYFFCVSVNSVLLKDPVISDILSGDCSYTFGSVVRSVGRIQSLEKLWKLEACCEVSLEWDRYFGYW